MTRAAAVIAVVLVGAMPAAAPQSPEAAPPREGEWNIRWDDHPEVEWSGRLRVEFRARLQGDSRASRAAVERLDGDPFDIGRRRIGIAGEIGGTLEFQIEREHGVWIGVLRQRNEIFLSVEHRHD